MRLTNLAAFELYKYHNSLVLGAAKPTELASKHKGCQRLLDISEVHPQ
jgi:hypothetical protein